MSLDLALEASPVGRTMLAWSAVTHVGKVRRANEDCVLAAAPVFVVADGMGGHQAGDVASALTVSRFRSLVGGESTETDAVAAELRHVNDLLRSAREGSDGTKMGTTAVGMALVEERGVLSWLVFNVGDSRAYCLVDGHLAQISRDHSMVQEMVDTGQITREQAAVHPHRNVVTRALGAHDRVQPDFWLRPLRAGERFLLCSDGLTGEVDDDLLAEVLGVGLTPDETADALLYHALRGGARDNVSVIVIDVVRGPWWDEPTTNPRGRGGEVLA